MKQHLQRLPTEKTTEWSDYVKAVEAEGIVDFSKSCPNKKGKMHLSGLAT